MSDLRRFRDGLGVVGIGEYCGLHSLPCDERVVFPLLQKPLRARPNLQQRYSSAAFLAGGVARGRTIKMAMARSRLLVCDRHIGQSSIGRPNSLFMEITPIAGKLFQTQFVGNQDCGLRDDCSAMDRK